MYMNQVHASVSDSRGDSETESIAQRGVHISSKYPVENGTEALRCSLQHYIPSWKYTLVNLNTKIPSLSQGRAVLEMRMIDEEMIRHTLPEYLKGLRSDE